MRFEQTNKFGISKKAFKMNVGILYKAKKITIEDGGIRLMPEAPATTETKEVS